MKLRKLPPHFWVFCLVFFGLGCVTVVARFLREACIMVFVGIPHSIRERRRMARQEREARL